MDMFKTPENVRLSGSNVAESWRKWEQQFRIYYTAAELSKKTKPTQVAILLHCAGPEAQDIHKTFVFDGENSKADEYEHVLAKFKAYCNPKKNEVYERHRLWTRNQREGEPVDQWITELRTLIEGCEYKCVGCNCNHMADNILRDRIVFGVNDPRVKERLLRETDLTLDRALDICRAAESTKLHMQAMSQSDTKEVHVMHKSQKPLKSHKTQDVRPKIKPPQRSEPAQKECEFCGLEHAKGKCPAYGRRCKKCSKWHHFACKCKSAPNTTSGRKSVHVVEEEDEGSLFVGSIENSSSKSWTEELSVEDGTRMTFKLDTGADTNVLPVRLYHQISKGKPLTKTKTILRAYGGGKFSALGKCDLQVSTPRISRSLTFYITDVPDVAILGKQACTDLNLVQRVPVNRLSMECEPLTKDRLVQEYADVFKGIGAYEQEYHIVLDESVPAVIQPSRKIPFTRRKPLKEALDKLESEGIIASVDRPTDWVHNLVITEKRSGALRLCLDPKPLNKAIKRERHVIPTAADVQAQLSGKKLFTVIDMRDSYWHVKLSEESSYYCTFHTPWGRKRFLRMPFGISSASEVMQKRNEETFADIPGVHIIADDMILAASDDAEHDAIAHAVMRRAREKNVRFNKEKLQYKVPQVTYMGDVITSEGLRPDPNKIEAIVNMPAPENRQALQRLLGMVKYLKQYIPNESTMTAPLRELLKQDRSFDWGHEHDQALMNIKEALTKPVMLQYYDVDQPVTIQTDASQSGLGSCLLQQGRPVAYASRALTSAEQNYSQIEKETLAICFACTKFHQYIYGKTVTVHTDHKPLEIIMKKPIAKAAPRLQRMMLQLQRYQLSVTFVPGKYMYVADTLSRAYVKGDPGCGAPEDIEVMVHSLVENLPISTRRRKEFQDETANDKTMRLLKQAVRYGWPAYRGSLPSELHPYWHIRDEIHEAGGLLFFGDRIIVPENLRSDMLRLIHESHLGMDKCKSRARGVLYWPQMSMDIEAVVSSCAICQKYRPSNSREPLIPQPLPDRPWQKVAMDIMTKGSDYLVVVDCFSKYIEIAKLEEKTARCCIIHLKSIFARHGIPEIIFSDNMPFGSRDFKDFADEWDIVLETSSPGYPQSNGQSERAVQTVKQLLRKAEEEGKDPYLALLEYRTTPVSGMQYSPAQMLMSRSLRTRIPCSNVLLEPAVVMARDELQGRQDKYKRDFDRGTKELESLQPGDSVHVQRGKHWEPAVVTQVAEQPRSYIVDNGTHELRRNRKHLNKTPASIRVPLPKDIIDIEPGYAEPAAPAHTKEVAAPDLPTTSKESQVADVPVTPTYTTSRGRTVRRPEKFKDYVA